MKKILFKKLSLLNFCGIRQAEFEFGEYITIISGGNGLGKSTVFNSISYCLFGKNSKGLAFDVKTYDKDHHIIKEIPHEVTLVLSVDGEEITLKRTLTDAWKGEQVTNTYKYFVNGEVTTAGDFKKAVDNIFPEVTFRLCSSATEFTSRPWAEQRNFLSSLVPSVTAEAVTQGEPKFDFVVEALKKEDITKVVQHLKYRRKEIQTQLDKIPVRLAELDKALPEQCDWEEIEKKKTELNAQLFHIENEIADAKVGGASNVIKEGIHNKIDFAQKRKRIMEQGALNLSTELATKHQSDVITANAALAKAGALAEELKAKMNEYTETEVHARGQKEECEKKVKEFNEKNSEIAAKTWLWNDKDSFCPHCLQPLPLDRLAEMKAESLKRFNEDIAEQKRQLQEDFGKLQQTYTELKKILEQVDEDRKITTEQIVKAQRAVNEAENNKAAVDKETPKTYEQILSEKEEYQSVTEELSKLEQELNNVQDGSTEEQQNLLKKLEEEREKLSIEYNEAITLLSTKENYNRISALIEEAKRDKVTFQDQLDELDKKIDIASEYNKLSCTILEERINEQFEFVKWTLFQTTQDGERKPYCECYHDGVPYVSLNAAAKVNAGIDIANTISRYYDVSIPMILDECESNLCPIYEGGQQIRLCVAPTSKLNIEYKED